MQAPARPRWRRRSSARNPLSIQGNVSPAHPRFSTGRPRSAPRKRGSFPGDPQGLAKSPRRPVGECVGSVRGSGRVGARTRGSCATSPSCALSLRAHPSDAPSARASRRPPHRVGNSCSTPPTSTFSSSTTPASITGCNRAGCCPAFCAAHPEPQESSMLADSRENLSRGYRQDAS